LIRRLPVNMTKIIIVFILSLVAFRQANCQNFEGKITYTVSCKSKTTAKTDKAFNDKYGSLHEFYIKDGNFKSIENSTTYDWNIYISKQNKLYRKYPNNKVIGIRDCATTYEYPVKIQLTKDSINILGYNCHEIIISYKCKIYKFYYSSDVAMDSGLFVDDNFEAWYEFISRTSALPLKIIVEADDHTLVKTAIKIEKIPINKTMFVLAKGTKTTPISVMIDCYK
jgi:hypothetical protein